MAILEPIASEPCRLRSDISTSWWGLVRCLQFTSMMIRNMLNLNHPLNLTHVAELQDPATSPSLLMLFKTHPKARNLRRLFQFYLLGTIA